MTQRIRSTWTTAWLTLAIVSTFLGTLTVARNREYRSGVTLAEVTFNRYPTPIAQHALAENLLAVGRRDEAMRLLWAAVPYAPRAHYTLGLELFKEGRLNEAIQQMRAFIALQPRLVWVIQAYGVLGQAYEAQSNWPAAIDAFEQVLARSPNNTTAERALGEALLAAGRADEAVAHYRRVISSRANDSDFLNQLGVALGSTGRLDEAVEVLRQAVSANPGHGPAQHNLALGLCQQGAVAESIVHARQAAALQPDNGDSQVLLQDLLALQAQHPDGAVCLPS